MPVYLWKMMPPIGKGMPIILGQSPRKYKSALFVRLLANKAWPFVKVKAQVSVYSNKVNPGEPLSINLLDIDNRIIFRRS